MSEIPKTYNPQDVEDKIYKIWEESGYFNPDNLELPAKAEKFSIAMPPPNVTGILHLGHALENTLMDTMIRYQRMRGKRALLVPGTDHAAVATQARVEKDLVKSGKYKNPRQELGREKLLEIIRDYAEKSKATILSQIRKMGTSCDWSRLAYTFDESRSRAVNEVFTRMYKDGLIYRGYRVINWSVKGQSTCSDEELVYVERPAKLYTFKYSENFPIPIATTRPETKLGDTAVAVNPEGKWKEYIGRTFEIKNFAGSVDLKIKVIGDKNVDEKFGTGALGVTPAHSMIDFEMYEREGDLDFIQVIDKEGLMTLKAGKEYQYLPVEEARKKVVQWLRDENLTEKEEDITQNVGTSDRFGDVVEVLPMTQWFVGVNKKIPGKKKSLKELMREAVVEGHKGDKKQKVKITPDRFEKIYLNWIDNLRDWCISRQIWWGHRIPVWYDLTEEEYKKYKDNPELFSNFLNYTEPARKMVGFKDLNAKGNWLQDPDTLDTWFSSGTWTFSILGWPASAEASAGKPDNAKDLKAFHPISWMQMGADIIFFWMARMILMSTYTLDQIPFKNVYFHGILRDKNGKKFSKSLGNNLDPLDIIKKYGTDALRLSLIIGTTPGNDARFYEEKVEGYRNFVNKLWNISRFILSSADIEKTKKENKKPKAKTLADQWILGKAETVFADATKKLDNYEFSAAAETLRDFTWNDFADWYLEISKIEKGKDEILIHILKNLLKVWHPFAPFVTEEIWSFFATPSPEASEDKSLDTRKSKDKKSIDGRASYRSGLLMIESWPIKSKTAGADSKASGEFDIIKNIITAIRNLRSENKVEPALKIKAIFVVGNKRAKDLIETQEEVVKGLARLSEFTVETKKGNPPAGGEKAVSALADGVEIYLPMEGLVDVKKELERIEKEIRENESKISDLDKRLSNENFVAKAKKEIVDKAKEDLKASKKNLDKLKERKKLLS